MSSPYNRVFNFSAGPCTLPVPVLEQCRDEMLNARGPGGTETGMSIMEMSHRSPAFEVIFEEAKANLIQLLNIPESHDVLFLQGGATLQFTMLAMNFLAGGNADYVVTGFWGTKAAEAALLSGSTNILFDGKSGGYAQLPSPSEVIPSPGANYLHFTSNETIQGVEFTSDPNWTTDLICDMSSDILSRPVDILKYGLIYAGAQKNMGPAGVTVVIIRKDWLDRIPANLPPMLDYRILSKNGSMYNTPPCWSIYVCGLVFKYLLAHGGVDAAQKLSRDRSTIVYDAIDKSEGFYKGHAAVGARSVMNVTFTLATEELTKAFLKECDANGLDGLKGHRSVGGCRASLYNAFPLEGCQALAKVMSEFAIKHR